MADCGGNHGSPSGGRLVATGDGDTGTVGTAPFFLTHTCARIKPGSALVIRSPYRPHSSDPLLGEPFEPPFLVVGFHRLFHLGAYTKVCMQGASQEQCVVLFGFFTVRDDFL